MSDFTHFDEEGRALMVDVGGKAKTARTATARGAVVMAPETLTMIIAGKAKKGDVLAVARIAGIQAGKDTARWIPLCHPLPLDSVEVHFERIGDDVIEVRAEARTTARTGVEMEALTAVSAALLTVYDMCKGMDRAMEIESIHLLEKEGGRSGRWRRDEGS